MNKVISLIFFASLFVVSGCISNMNHLHHASLQIAQTSYTEQQVEHEILSTVTNRGWHVDTKQPGCITASITGRIRAISPELREPISASIVITYSNSVISINFADDEKKQLNASGYGTLNNWIKQLGVDLKNKFHNSVLVRG